MLRSRTALALFAVSALLAAPAAATAGQRFSNIPYAAWTNDEPQYRLYPGDELDVAIPSAPELNKTVVVQPDGRVMLPLVAPQMAAGRSAMELQGELSRAYATQLLRPDVSVVVRAKPLQVFVGGEVGKPGVYDMPGDMDSLRAIIEAGGFVSGAKRSQVVIIRRSRDGRPMMRTVDLERPLKDAGGAADLVPLRRFDIIYVPKTGLAEVADFMTTLRNALPISFSYAIGGLAAAY
ncbi:MAG TPA: polysaccharide biosynthesis/export family protein [Caulobacteraceae bacterium]|jgi:polysaccharide export outer membrane protein|nr:polysaccharide biosynthesis/export family protein [Caulobacteraceae bacterium]